MIRVSIVNIGFLRCIRFAVSLMFSQYLKSMKGSHPLYQLASLASSSAWTSVETVHHRSVDTMNLILWSTTIATVPGNQFGTF